MLVFGVDVPLVEIVFILAIIAGLLLLEAVIVIMLLMKQMNKAKKVLELVENLSTTILSIKKAEIEELALGLETLLTQRTHGQWKYVGFSGDNIPRNAGEFALASDDLSAQDNILTINLTDLNGMTVGLSDVKVGDYIEIVDDDDPANYALFSCTKVPEGTGISNIEVALKDKGNNFLVGDTCEIRFFAINDQNLDLPDLDDRYDARYAAKAAEHLNVSHQLEDTAWYNAPHKFAIKAEGVDIEMWTDKYYRLAHTEAQKGLLCISTSSPDHATVDWQPVPWSSINADGETRYYLRNTDSRLDGQAMKVFRTKDTGNVIVINQPSTGASLSLHVTGYREKTVSSVTEHGVTVVVRRRSGTPSENGEWRVYLQKEFLSAKGHDHWIGTLNTRETRYLRKWKSLGSTECALTNEVDSSPTVGSYAYAWKQAKQFKIYSGQFAGSSTAGDYPNGLGIVTFQGSLNPDSTLYACYLTTSNCRSNNGDHCWYITPFSGARLDMTVAEYDREMQVATNGLIQNSRTLFNDLTSTNIYTVGSDDEDIENPERPIWTGDNFGDFKSLNEFIAELKSALDNGEQIDFLISQWQTYWYTPGR